MQKSFRDIIIESGVVARSYAVYRPAWDCLVTGEAREHFGTAEMMCFGGCITGAVEAARRYYPDETDISLHFDKGRRSSELQSLFDVVEANYNDIPRITKMVFDVVASSAALQAADTNATENYWHAKNSLSLDDAYQATPRPHFQRLLQNVGADGYILDDEMIRETLRNNGF